MKSFGKPTLPSPSSFKFKIDVLLKPSLNISAALVTSWLAMYLIMSPTALNSSSQVWVLLSTFLNVLRSTLRPILSVILKTNSNKPKRFSFFSKLSPASGVGLNNGFFQITDKILIKESTSSGFLNLSIKLSLLLPIKPYISPKSDQFSNNEAKSSKKVWSSFFISWLMAETITSLLMPISLKMSETPALPIMDLRIGTKPW